MSKFNTIASSWDSNPKVIETSKATIQAIKENIDINNKDILDYGAGTGLLSFGLFEDALSIECLDNSYAMLRELNTKIDKFGVTNMSTMLHDADYEIMPYDKYDIMVSNMTLHHILHPDKFIKGLYMSIKESGGYIAIADLDIEDGSFHADNEGVQHFGFSKKYMYEILENAGFEISFFDYIHTIKKTKEYKVFLIIGKKLS